jgi:hypothetical protein
MKFKTIFRLALVVAFLVSCSDSLSGRYVNAENSSEFLEFKSDGKYIARLQGKTFPGRYELDETRLVLKGVAGRPYLAEIEGDSIRSDEDGSWLSGKNWIKQ